MATTNWALDAAHSRIGFRVKHLVISSVHGHFDTFDATVQSEGDDFSTASVKFEADIASINTGNEGRDGHLKSADFFDAENHPKLTFESTRVEKTGDEEYNLHGNLSIRGVTKPITLKVTHGGIVTDPWGNVKAGFEIEGKINRKEFGLNWSAVTETGGLVVGDDVRLHAEVEFAKQAQEAAV